ncbi:MAG: hypothetical protein Q4D38_02135 [Planctomycetia bacterium]|nr:hypothetical protein [Planctomycetia bacterium]
MSKYVEKDKSYSRAMQFGLIFMTLAGLVCIILGLRLLTKDLPAPENKNAPILTPAPKIVVGAPSSSKKDEPLSYFQSEDGVVLNSHQIQGDESRTGARIENRAGNQPEGHTKFHFGG